MSNTLDEKNMLGSIDNLSKQVKHAWTEVKKVTIPENYKQVNKIVLFGMGGSALGMDIIKAAFSDKLELPILIENNYNTPEYVDENSLVILSSYSGTTEEVVTVGKTIIKKTNKVLVITTGGDLKILAEENNFPTFIIDPVYNKCGQPRIAVGYAVIGLLGLLHQAGIMALNDQSMDDVVHFLDGNRELLRDEAIKLVDVAKGKSPIFIGSEFLTGNLHVVANQTNENGKNFATYFTIPELNHHLLEGLGFPASNKENLHFVCIESNFYHERVQRRYDITKEVLEKQNISHSSFIPTANDKLQQVFEVLQWGSYVSYYLSQTNQIDPSPIPWVDYFKDELKK